MKTLIVMRGLPWCGKSYTANVLKGENGVIFSTDEYWYVISCPEKPDEYSFNPKLIGEAHRWNQARAIKAMDEGAPLIIIDNTNTTAEEALPYVSYGKTKGYDVRIQEPTSDRWFAINKLLENKEKNSLALTEWALVLEHGSKETHNVPAIAIERMIGRWQYGLTPEKIMGVTE